jgi:hypothetical protein
MKKFAISLFLRVPIRHSIVTCLALLTVCALLLLTTVNVLASTVTINDQAGVLDAGRVQADAAKLPDPMLIYTTKTFTGDQDALNQSTREQLPNQDSIAIGIDTVHRHLSIEAGTNVQLSDSQASDAVSAFQSNYDNGGDYTSATIAAIDSIQNTYNSNGFPVIIGFLIPIFFMIVVAVLGVLKIIPVTFEWRGSGGGGGSGGGAGGSF